MKNRKEIERKCMSMRSLQCASRKRTRVWKEMTLSLEKDYCERIRQLYIVEVRLFCFWTSVFHLKLLTCSCYQRREKWVKSCLWKMSATVVLKTKNMHVTCTFSFKARTAFKAVLCKENCPVQRFRGLRLNSHLKEQFSFKKTTKQNKTCKGISSITD